MAGLATDSAPLTPRAICSPQTLGQRGGAWCPFGSGTDQAGDQREDDALSLVFETDAACRAGSNSSARRSSRSRLPPTGRSRT